MVVDIKTGESLVHSAFRSIMDYIRENDLRVGDELPSESEFVTRLGVSRTVVREAFGALAALRLIDVGNGRRARVGALDDSVLALSLEHAVRTEQSSVQQIWDVRRALEQRTAALAALRRSKTEAVRIQNLATAMRGAGDDIAAQTGFDIEFHVAIAAATRNPMFGLLISSFKLIMRQTCPVGWRSRRTAEERLEVFAQHDRIAAAIAAQDPDAAFAAMTEHFDLSTRALINSGFN